MHPHRLAATWTICSQYLLGKLNNDRGEGPVSTSIIVAGLAILAAAVVAWAVTKANGYMASAPGAGNP